MQGLNNIMMYNQGFISAVPSILGLLAYGLVCYIIGLRLFKFQEQAA
jgi:ABC-2 type transport system permease protein